jgi:hypothetical protein
MLCCFRTDIRIVRNKYIPFWQNHVERLQINKITSNVLCVPVLSLEEIHSISAQSEPYISHIVMKS